MKVNAQPYWWKIDLQHPWCGNILIPQGPLKTTHIEPSFLLRWQRRMCERRALKLRSNSQQALRNAHLSIGDPS